VRSSVETNVTFTLVLRCCYVPQDMLTRPQTKSKMAQQLQQQRVTRPRVTRQRAASGAAAAPAAAEPLPAAADKASEAPKPGPDLVPCQVVIIMLIHETGCKHWELWQHLERLGYRVVCHLKKSVRVTKYMPGYDFIKRRLVPYKYRVNAEWGKLTLLEAQLRSVDYGLEAYPEARSFYFASGTCIPVQVG
jgi:hypothetical protein